MDSILLLISNSFSLFSRIMDTVPVGITITFLFPSLYHSLTRSKYLSLFKPSFIFTQCSAETAKSSRRKVFFSYHSILGLVFLPGLLFLFLFYFFENFLIPALADGFSMEFESPGLFTVFWPTLTIMYFGWSPLILLFPSLLISLLILW